MIRQKALRRYGGTCTCPCGCREPDLRVLQIDHLFGGGNQEREDLRGLRFWTKLINEPLRTDLRLLCANCHVTLTQHGGCTRGQITDSAGEIKKWEAIVEESHQGEAEGTQVPGVTPAPLSGAKEGSDKTFAWLTPAGIAAAEEAARRGEPSQASITPVHTKRRWRLWP